MRAFQSIARHDRRHEACGNGIGRTLKGGRSRCIFYVKLASDQVELRSTLNTPA
jgi:hypothetical protein